MIAHATTRVGHTARSTSNRRSRRSGPSRRLTTSGVSVGATDSAVCFTSTNSLRSDPLRFSNRQPGGLWPRLPGAPARSSRQRLDRSTQRDTNPQSRLSKTEPAKVEAKPSFWDPHAQYLIFRAETLLDLAEVVRRTGRQGEASSRVEGALELYRRRARSRRQRGLKLCATSNPSLHD